MPSSRKCRTAWHLGQSGTKLDNFPLNLLRSMWCTLISCGYSFHPQSRHFLSFTFQQLRRYDPGHSFAKAFAFQCSSWHFLEQYVLLPEPSLKRARATQNGFPQCLHFLFSPFQREQAREQKSCFIVWDFLATKSFPQCLHRLITSSVGFFWYFLSRRWCPWTKWAPLYFGIWPHPQPQGLFINAV